MFTSAPGGVKSIAIFVYVYLSVYPLAYFKNNLSKLYKIFCTLPVAVARFSCDDHAICYVLPVYGWHHVFTWRRKYI